MKRILFIDRDGTIIQEPPDEQIDSLEKLVFVPGAISNLRKIREQSDYLFVMVSNQDGLGTDSFPEDTFWLAHNKMLEILENEQVIFDNILIDRSFPHENLPTRKPGTAMMKPYMNSSEIDMANSYVLGDRKSDVQLAGNLGCQAIYISIEDCPDAALVTTDWDQIYRFLCLPPRTAKVERKTNETDILVEVNLDGKGKSDLNSGIGFLDHMLDQLARHSGMDLTVKCNGDLEVDEHHSAEDIALAIGQALKSALGDKKGISRFGFMAPMDECLAQVALDFSGRPELVWKVDFKREYIGKMPTELFRHFFKSLSDTSAMTLNIQADGENEHHKIEAVFKAFGRALKMAISRDGSNSVPSTKGIL